jgi:1-acyl-sn-glycerol-3-phosphate acyltransferase
VPNDVKAIAPQIHDAMVMKAALLCEGAFGYGGAVIEFESIRPYRDDEVAAVLRRLGRDPAMLRDVARFVAPSLNRLAAPAARWWIGRKLRAALSGIDTIDAFQRELAKLFERMIKTTTDGFSATGLESLDPSRNYLFISNHRDIALDSGFVNLALYRAGHSTTRMAFGDNLLSTGYAADVMRLNKGFVVQRGKKAGKVAFASMSLTSRYIRHSLETGSSVWIAQREGRAKDGLDLTEPALIKMLSLAFRSDVPDISAVIERLCVVPVAVSYEIDPCDEMKARELLAIAEHGEYRKAPGEDLRTIITGVAGMKGRVQLSIGAPLVGDFADADAVTAEIDRRIGRGYRLFPTHLHAGRLSGLQCEVPQQSGKQLALFEARLARTPLPLREQIIRQYANPVARAMGLGAS